MNNVSKSIFGKLLKIGVLHNRAIILHENDAKYKLSKFRPICNKKVTDKLSRYIPE